MNTRKALKIMSGGKHKDTGNVAGPLAKRANKYKKAYEAKEAAIEARKNVPVISAPVIDVLRQKLAAAIGSQDASVPVVMRFDAYQVVKHAADTAKRQDRGLMQFARHLEKLWTEDPMGSLTVGQLREMRAHYKDSYPKSRVEKVIDVEIPKVGYSTLPVAKLARIASTIKDQTDFDNAIQLHGLNGDQMGQVRARTLIRELVALKSANLDARIAEESDDRTNFERVTDKIGQMMDDELPPPPPGEEIMMEEEIPLDGLPGEEIVMDEAMPPGEEGEMGGLEEGLQEVINVGQEVLPQMPGAEEYAEAEVAEGQTPPTQDPLAWAFEEGREEGPDGQPLHSAPPPSKPWQQEELDEHGKPGLEEPMGEEEIFQLEEEPAGMPMMGRKAQMEQVSSPRRVPVLEDVHELPGNDDMPVEELGLDAQDIRPNMVTEQDDLASVVSKNHSSPYAPSDLTPGNNPGQGLDLDKKRQRDNPHVTFPRKGEAEQSGEKAMNPPKPPANGETKVETYMPTPAKDGGTELKKGGIGFTAAEIENALLDQGAVVKIGRVSISINDQTDEVELWVKDAGRACDLRHLDTAIADFIRYASEEINPNPVRKGGYKLTKLVPVPCGKCASVSRFPPTNDPNDIYECDCGHRTRAATVISLVKHGTIGHEYKLELQLPAKYTADVKQAKQAMRNAIQQLVSPIVPTARIESFDGNGATIHIAGVTDTQIQKLTQKLRSSGMPKISQMDPGIPGGADMPLAPEPTQTEVAPGAPAEGNKDKGNEYGVHQNNVDTDMIGAAFKHYKAMGMPFLESIKTFTKDYSEAIENHWSPDMDAAVIQIAEQLYTGGPAPQTPPPDAVSPAAPAEPPPPPPPAGPGQAALTAARRILAQAKANMSPKVNQTQGDQVKGVGKKPLGPGKDSEQGSDFKTPEVKKKHPVKQKSPTDMGKFSDDKDPGSFGAGKPNQHSNVPKKVTKDTNLGKDSDTFGKGIPVPKVTKNH